MLLKGGPRLYYYTLFGCTYINVTRVPLGMLCSPKKILGQEERISWSKTKWYRDKAHRERMELVALIGAGVRSVQYSSLFNTQIGLHHLSSASQRVPFRVDSLCKG